MERTGRGGTAPGAAVSLASGLGRGPHGSRAGPGCGGAVDRRQRDTWTDSRPSVHAVRDATAVTRPTTPRSRPHRAARQPGITHPPRRYLPRTGCAEPSRFLHGRPSPARPFETDLRVRSHSACRATNDILRPQNTFVSMELGHSLHGESRPSNPPSLNGECRIGAFPSRLGRFARPTAQQGRPLDVAPPRVPLRRVCKPACAQKNAASGGAGPPRTARAGRENARRRRGRMARFPPRSGVMIEPPTARGPAAEPVARSAASVTGPRRPYSGRLRTTPAPLPPSARPGGPRPLSRQKNSANWR